VPGVLDNNVERFFHQKNKNTPATSCCKIKIPDREPQSYIPKLEDEVIWGIKKIRNNLIIYKERKGVNLVLN
jgi:hypothetical protein